MEVKSFSDLTFEDLGIGQDLTASLLGGGIRTLSCQTPKSPMLFLLTSTILSQDYPGHVYLYLYCTEGKLRAGEGSGVFLGHEKRSETRSRDAHLRPQILLPSPPAQWRGPGKGGSARPFRPSPVALSC